MLPDPYFTWGAGHERFCAVFAHKCKSATRLPGNFCNGAVFVGAAYSASIETLGTLVEPSLLSNHYSWALVSV